MTLHHTWLFHTNRTLAQVVLASVDIAVNKVRTAEEDRSYPDAHSHHSGGQQVAPSLHEDGLPDAEGSVQADHGQQEDGAEHVGVLEKPVELAEEDAEGPVIEEELLDEGEDSSEAEDEVGYCQVHQPHVGHLRLEPDQPTGWGQGSQN